MSDYGTMTSRILDDMNRTDLTSQAQSAIKSAIAFYENRRFWFLEQRPTSNTVAGQEFYGLPSDFLDSDSLVLEVNNWTYPLHERRYNVLEDWFVKSATFTGYPTDYAIYDKQIRLYPIPNSDTYTFTLSYYKRLSSLGSDSDTNDWMTEGEELIRRRAEWTLNSGKLRDYDAAQACKMLEQEALLQHERLTRARLLTGHTKKRTIGRYV